MRRSLTPGVETAQQCPERSASENLVPSAPSLKGWTLTLRTVPSDSAAALIGGPEGRGDWGSSAEVQGSEGRPPPDGRREGAEVGDVCQS